MLVIKAKLRVIYIEPGLQEVKTNAKQGNDVTDHAIVMDVRMKLSALNRLVTQWNGDNMLYPIQLSYPPLLANFKNSAHLAERDMAKAIAGINKWIAQFHSLKPGTELERFPPGLQYEGLSLMNTEGVVVDLPKDDERRQWLEHIQKDTESEGRKFKSLEIYQREMLDLIIVTDIARSSPLIMKDVVCTAIDEDLWTHQDYDWVTKPGVERNNLQTLDPKPIVRRRELMKILHVILSDKPDPVLTYHTQLIDESSLEQRHVLKPDNMASTRAYQRLDEGDVWGGILNPRAPIHEDISQAGTEEDDDVIMCDEVDLVSRRVEAVARDEEGRESEIEREQEEQVRAAQHAHKKQRTASPDHRTDPRYKRK